MKFLPRLAFIILFILFTNLSNAQVGIGTSSPDPSAALDISANNKGVLIPRLTTSEINAIVSPANGLMVYNTDSDEVQFNSNNITVPIWKALSLTSTSVATPGDSVKYSNIDTSTDINQGAITAPIFGNALWNDDTTLYAVSGNQITITEAGRYEFIINLSISNAGGDRNAPEMRIKVNGSGTGSFGSTGYMRNRNNHEDASLHLREVLELNANDLVTLSIQSSANSGAVNLRSAGSSTIYIEKKL